MNRDVKGFRVELESVDSMQLDGEAVLLHLETHRYFGLNATGTDVWHLLKSHQGISATQVSASIAHRYRMDTAKVAADVEAMIGALLGHQLIAECASAHTAAPQLEPSTSAYVAPHLEAFGDLDTLILSGE